MKKKIKCHWCGESRSPFHKLRDNNFICENCYQELEKQQKEYEET